MKTEQKIVNDWIKSYGVKYFDIQTNLGMLMEEVGEFARIVNRKYGMQSFKNNDNNSDLADELSDILFVLFCIANSLEIDLDQSFKRNIKKKTMRDSLRHKENNKLKD